MPRIIAHLSDVHILHKDTPRSGTRYRIATKFVSLGRAIDPLARAKKLARSLAAAREKGAEHVVISGDLTELGDAGEFEHLSEILHDARFPEDAITLVPGNHDAYTSERGWKKALEGPLAPFSKASATEPGKLVDRGDIVFLPIDTSCFQSLTRAGGVFTRNAARAVERRLLDPALRDRALVLVLHHPPFVLHRLPVMRWFDGLRGCTHVLELLMRHPRLHLLHGHLHRAVDRFVGRANEPVRADGARPRVFGASAVCDDRDDGDPRIRLYEVSDGMLQAA
jgi:3',5'-cyclic-AMP phosphodiesterase